jgi:ribosomal protein S18 acetylase RimI-like enzyme
MADSLVFERLAAGALDADRALRLAELSVSAQPEFYRLMPIPRDAMLHTVARQLADPVFDMAEAFALRDSEDAALVASVDLAALAAAQMATLMAFLRLVPASGKKAFQAQMRAYAASIEPIADSGRYVSRIAVAARQQGQGLGRKAMSEFLALGDAAKVHLHVHRDNARAIALYRSLGFAPRGGAAYLFPAFTRPSGVG